MEWTRPPPFTAAVQVPPHLLSRLVYTNPVCLLVAEVPAAAASSAATKHNVMTISWLSALNNTGMCTISMNARRFTASLPCAQPGGVFTLSVPVRGMEQLLKAIGACTGREIDKLKTFGVELCAPGWGTADVDSPSERPAKRTRSKKELKRIACAAACASTRGCADCVAHMICRTHTVQEIDGHRLIVCQIEFGFVRSEWWRDGKLLCPTRADLPGTLTFFGSGEFSETRATATATAAAAPVDSSSID